MDDSREWVPYPDSVSALLETHFTRYSKGEGSHLCDTQTLSRYVDSRQQRYQVDFESMIQINLATGYRRQITRKRDSKSLSQSVQWQVLIGSQWCPFYDSVQDRMEQAYTAFKSGSGPGIVEHMVLHHSHFCYTMDFENFTQKNEQTGMVREIRRSSMHGSSNLSRDAQEEDITIQFPSAMGADDVKLALQCIEKLEPELNEIVRTASGVQTKTVRVVVDEDKIILKLNGVARTICSLLAGRIQKALHFSLQGPTHAHFRTTGEHGTRMRDYPRLMQMLSPQAPLSRWRSRNDVILILAHAAVWSANCTVYGGFIRDWVIRGEEANDIDVMLPDESTSAQNAAMNTILRAAEQYGVEFVQSRAKGAAHTLVFMGAWTDGVNGRNTIDVDLVAPNVNKTPPFVDCDVGNLCINAQKGLVKKSPNAGEPILNIAKSISHCQKKKFVFFYDCSVGADRAMCVRRLQKYLQNGWRCVSPLPQDVVNTLMPKYGALLTPKQKYNKKWWIYEA